MARWTKEELEILRDGYEKDVPVSVLASQLGRKESAIYAKANRLGITKDRSHSKKDFVRKVTAVHGDAYDYHLAEYRGHGTKLQIICNRCKSSFWQTPRDHVRGFGCPTCGVERIREKNTLTKNEFIKRAKALHGNKYEYSGDYKSSHVRMEIICPHHGPFYQTPNSHLNGSGCKNCGLSSMGRKRRLTKGEFIERATAVHFGAYDYSQVDYRGSNRKVSISCPEHGAFLQTPGSHIYGRKSGCPKCKVSYPHKVLCNLLDEWGVDHCINNRDFLGGKELDIYIPEKKMAVEINGFWYHRHDHLEDPYYHNNKFRGCEAEGIDLVQFWGADIINKLPIVKSMMMSKLGLLTNRVFARKCLVKSIDSSIYEVFLDQNHIQGRERCGLRYGLFLDERLVAVMGFSSRNGRANLTRFCSLLERSVVGGFSKLLKFAIENNQWEKVFSFSDNFYSRGDVYRRAGFQMVRENRPRLHYTDLSKLYNRRNFQRRKMMSRHPHLTEDMSEREMAEALGYYQVYGGGTRKWELAIDSEA